MSFRNIGGQHGQACQDHRARFLPAVQRIFVEVSVAFQRDAGERAVKERAFQLVDLRGVGRGEEQVKVEESARDGGAGFEVTVVR